MSTPTKSPSAMAVQPSILTAIAVVIGIAIAAYFPPSIVALYLAVLPLPLLMLWLAHDVPAPCDRIAAVDMQRLLALAPPRTNRRG